MRKLRVKDLHSKEIIANNNSGLKIFQKILDKIFQNYASFININR